MRRYGLATFWRDKQPGKKDKERGLMETRVEGEGTGWRKKKDVLSGSD